MSSQFNAFAATAHRADLHRDAERTRRPVEDRAEDRGEPIENPFPTMLRSRRLGRLFRVVPSPGRPAA